MTKPDTRFNINILKSTRLWILVVVMAVMAVLQPGIFLTGSNIRSIFLSISIYGIMTCGTIYPILLGGIDLSVGAVAASAGAICVVQIVNSDYSAAGVATGLIGGLAFGCLVGLIHGLIISKFEVPPFLITLASQNIIYGIAQLLTDNTVIACMKPAFFTNLGGGRFLAIPSSVWLLGFAAVISWIILNKTVFGRQVYAVGGNVEASRLSGVKSTKVILLSYMASGLTAATAGIVLASMNRQAIAKAAQGYDNFVLTALVVGGASLMGGEGNVTGAIWGAFLVGTVSNALRLLGVDSEYHGIFKCLIIVAIVTVDAQMRYRSSGLQKGGLLGRLRKNARKADH